MSAARLATARAMAGWAALGAYLVMGAVLYFRVLPNVGWLWPPDFHLTGYDADSIAPFLEALGNRAERAYVRLLSVYDRVFIVAFALWMALTGWRGSGLRYLVAGLAALYAVIDLAENAVLLRVVRGQVDFIDVAHHVTMAKFAAAYLCILVLVAHVRRSA